MGRKINSSESPALPTNKPRNLLVQDATTPLHMEFQKHGIQTKLTIHQTADEETWPGGAVWDSGWLMAQLLVGIVGATTPPNSKRFRIHIPTRIRDNHLLLPCPCRTILELGCGVGLTGLAAAAALRANTLILTDLAVVVDRVTRSNVARNATRVLKQNSTNNNLLHSHEHMLHNSRIVVTPLCWGDQQDEQHIQSILESLATCRKRSSRSRARNSSKHQHPSSAHISWQPDLVLIGDVAYQHKPGAPSHFDALVSTLLKMVIESTVVIFGTRIRMPASHDLLELLLEHFQEIVEPVRAEELLADAFCGVKHNMSVHFLQLKAQSSE